MDTAREIEAFRALTSVNCAAASVKAHEWRGDLKSDRMKRRFKTFQRGGDSAAGSGGGRAGNASRSESCAQNGKKITSFAAIVAPYPCDCGQGRVRCSLAPARPVHFFLPSYLSFFRSPCPDSSTLYSSGFRQLCFVQKLNESEIHVEPLEWGYPSCGESIRKGSAR